MLEPSLSFRADNRKHNGLCFVQAAPYKDWMSELTFENRQGLHSDWLELFAKHGERVIIVRVEAEALREYGRGDGMLERYFNYPEQFHDVAAWKLDAGLLEDDGSVMVRSADFDV